MAKDRRVVIDDIGGPNDLDCEMHAKQTHCYTCGKRFDRVMYECPICGEWQCSEECRNKHIEIMDNI